MDKKIKILVVDDNLDIKSMYADIFRQEGFDVFEAGDGLKGLDVATKELPDIIFTGIIMPRMDGFGLKKALEKNVSTAKIPVVMISHMGREEDRKKSFEMGIKDFIVQGMATPRQVVDSIKNIINPSEDYKLQLNPNDPEAQKLAMDLKMSPSLKCSKCSSEMVLKLHKVEEDKNDFKAKLACPECK